MQLSAINVGRISAFLAPIVGFSSILLAIAYSPWFSWENNALSDLGVSGTGSVIFNTGLVATGLIVVPLGLGLRDSFQGKVLGQAGASLLALDGLFLLSIGVFPETSGRIHFYVSVGFFATLGASLIVMSIQLLQESMTRVFGIATVILVVVEVVSWVSPHNGVAIPETVSGIAASIWTMTAGYRLLGKNRRP